MVRDRGFEPLTPSVSRKCSTTELTAHPAVAQTLGPGISLGRPVCDGQVENHLPSTEPSHGVGLRRTVKTRLPRLCQRSNTFWPFLALSALVLSRCQSASMGRGEQVLDSVVVTEFSLGGDGGLYMGTLNHTVLVAPGRCLDFKATSQVLFKIGRSTWNGIDFARIYLAEARSRSESLFGTEITGGPDCNGALPARSV